MPVSVKKISIQGRVEHLRKPGYRGTLLFLVSLALKNDINSNTTQSVDKNKHKANRVHQ